MQPIATVTAKIRTEDVDLAIAVAAPVFKARTTGANNAPGITEMFFSAPSKSDHSEATKDSDSLVLNLEVLLESEGIWYDITGWSVATDVAGQ